MIASSPSPPAPGAAALSLPHPGTSSIATRAAPSTLFTGSPFRIPGGTPAPDHEYARGMEGSAVTWVTGRKSTLQRHRFAVDLDDPFVRELREHARDDLANGADAR